MKKVIILSNGPGEVWGWARPLAAELKRRGYYVILWLLPCQFSSGNEKALCRFIESDEIHGPCGTIKTLHDFRRVKGDLVIQLGGDLLFGRGLAGFLNKPLICYAYGPKKGMDKCEVLLSAFEWMVESIHRKTGSPVELVGDLTLDALKMDSGENPWEAGKGTRIALFPGSRPHIREKARFFLAEVVGELRRELPDLKVITPFLPDITEDEKKKWEDMGLAPTISGSRTVLESAHMALTQPGTNNFEIMHMGTPSIVALPFDFLELVPLSGIKGMVASLPGVGPWVKMKWLRRMDRYTGYLSWPNRMAGKEIMTEIRGDLSPYDLSHSILSLLSQGQELQKQRQELMSMSRRSPLNASHNICELLERLV